MNFDNPNDLLKLFPHNQAADIAIAVCRMLEPYCSKLNIAGSIRRKMWEVKDIEIVCSPYLAPRKDPNVKPKPVVPSLFGDCDSNAIMMVPEKMLPILPFVDTVMNLGKVIKGKPEGRYMQILLPQSIKLDLFIPDPPDYYRQYTIRTGSAEWVAKNIAIGWRKLGWCGTDQGLRLMSECEGKKGTDGKVKWKCTTENPTLPPVWVNELDFFKWLGLEWIEPQKRR